MSWIQDSFKSFMKGPEISHVQTQYAMNTGKSNPEVV